jgi:hypothetical protein
VQKNFDCQTQAGRAASQTWARRPVLRKPPPSAEKYRIEDSHCLSKPTNNQPPTTNHPQPTRFNTCRKIQLLNPSFAPLRLRVRPTKRRGVSCTSKRRKLYCGVSFQRAGLNMRSPAVMKGIRRLAQPARRLTGTRPAFAAPHPIC